MEILKVRYEYFKSKSITELTENEIKEYLALKEEILETSPLKEFFEVFSKSRDRALGILREVVKPYEDARNRYQERVINKK